MDEVPRLGLHQTLELRPVEHNVDIAGETGRHRLQPRRLLLAPFEIDRPQVAPEIFGRDGRDLPALATHASHLVGQPPVQRNDIGMGYREDAPRADPMAGTPIGVDRLGSIGASFPSISARPWSGSADFLSSIKPATRSPPGSDILGTPRSG